LRRDEAVLTLKEISGICEDISAVSLIESKPTDRSSGYQLHIKSPIAHINKQLINGICKKHDLAVAEYKDEVIIYKPKVQ
jgi:hypothetical protein